MPGFHVEHFGCRAARADGEAIGERLRAAGQCERQPTDAEVVIVNTCSVTAEADRAARAFIRRVHRLNPTARIVVTGCYAQRAPEEVAKLAGVAVVVGNSHKGLAPEIILGLTGQAAAQSGSGLVRIQSAQTASLQKRDAAFASEERASAPPQVATAPAQVATAPAQVVWVDDRFAHSFLEEAQLKPGEQTRPNLKIQEGCGNRCSFCVIPQTRGGSKSLAAAAVLRQVEGFVAAGGNELVLSGINLGRWGRDLTESTNQTEPRRLAALVREIFERTALKRLRLSSIEPMDWDAELIGLMAEFGNSGAGKARLARHAHLPLQSGSDAVLRRMHRRYRPWHYAEKVAALLKAAGPELTVGADVMVGFPGESDGEFEETLELVRKLPFGYLHLFSFSPRPATRAWELHKERPVAAAAVEERMKALRALAAEKSEAHRKSTIGLALEAITLHTPTEMEARGQTAALTENFLPVELEGRLEANRLVRVLVTGVAADGALTAKIAAADLAEYLYERNISMAV